MDETSFVTTTSESFESDVSIPPLQTQLAYATLSSVFLLDLKDIPNAAYLRSIEPQTMTVCLVVGIIAISQPRTITTRKGGRTIELVEMLVGDDTRTGFGINIWLQPVPTRDSNASRTAKIDNLRDAVLQLRPRDVILATRVALGSYQGKVYGQSLRRGLTSLDLLYRAVVDARDTRGALTAKEVAANAHGSMQFTKVEKVRDWVVQFIGTATMTAQSREEKRTRSGREKTRLPVLPPDTQ